MEHIYAIVPHRIAQQKIIFRHHASYIPGKERFPCDNPVAVDNETCHHTVQQQQQQRQKIISCPYLGEVRRGDAALSLVANLVIEDREQGAANAVPRPADEPDDVPAVELGLQRGDGVGLYRFVDVLPAREDVFHRLRDERRRYLRRPF